MVPKGFSFAGVRCGLKNKRNDLGIVMSDRPTRTAGVLTTNQVRAACVDYTRSVLAGGNLRAVVVNSGNANCCTGIQGQRDTQRMAELTAEALNLKADQIGVGSTGIIGQLLDMAKVQSGIANASQAFSDDPVPFMNAILTTDTVEKWAWRALDDGAVATPNNPSPVREDANGIIYGVCKGSGMIAPNMATMLAYILTDLNLDSLDVDAILKRAVDVSFNRMTVDGDTSTNDMLIVMGNGASGVTPTEAQFEKALTDVCTSLAKQVARDGEGATKLVEVRVHGTSNPNKIARTIAESPLVKTAMFGCDPNWGRILMAAGRAGVEFSANDLRLVITTRDESHLLFEAGTPAPFDAHRVSTALKNDHVVIDLWIGEGETATVYTCDLGYGYVRINADYHT